MFAILNSAGRRDNFKCVSGFSSVCDPRISLIFRKSFFINIVVSREPRLWVGVVFFFAVEAFYVLKKK